MTDLKVDRRKSIAEPPKRRKTDTLQGLIGRIDTIEEWAIDHQEHHGERVRKDVETYIKSPAFLSTIQCVMANDDMQKAFTNAKNKIIGEIITAIFTDKRTWAVIGLFAMMLTGYDFKPMKDLLIRVLT